MNLYVCECATVRVCRPEDSLLKPELSSYLVSSGDWALVANTFTPEPSQQPENLPIFYSEA